MRFTYIEYKVNKRVVSCTGLHHASVINRAKKQKNKFGGWNTIFCNTLNVDTCILALVNFLIKLRRLFRTVNFSTIWELILFFPYVLFLH